MIKTDSDGLPVWANVGKKRLAHIERVTSLLRAWGAAMRLDPKEAQAWIDAGAWHDSLRDAEEEELRELTGDYETPVDLLHGPAAAARLEKEGETRRDVLDAIR
jgi:2-amino-4-hydroxy-6-hydroxymethyldihydropteridine diphosphokinase